jgi:hypothetical protein
LNSAIVLTVSVWRPRTYLWLWFCFHCHVGNVLKHRPGLLFTRNNTCALGNHIVGSW